MLTLFNNKTNFIFKHNLKATARANDLLFIFVQLDVVVGANKALTLTDLCQNGIDFTCVKDYLFCFGSIDNQQCFCLKNNLPQEYYSQFNRLTLKTAYDYFSESVFYAAILANHISHWLLGHRYCGSCSMQTTPVSKELSLICTNNDCKMVIYPTIAPVVIGLIYRDNEILLAKHRYSTQPIHSCLAGFVAPGENLEAALAREVNEETSLQITNIKYMASQPWPFPNSLMAGFIARYSSGEINIDTNELESAAWYDIRHVEKLPLLPAKLSLSRYLIDNFLLHHAGN